MDFAARADDVGLEGDMCRVCDSVTVGDTPIYHEVDGGYGDDGAGTRVNVYCAWCWEALKHAEIATWFRAADLAVQHGYRPMADDCARRARAISDALDRAMKAAK